MGSRLRKLSVEELYQLKWLVGAIMAIVSIGSLFNLENHTWVPALISVSLIFGCVVLPKVYAKTPPVIWKIFAFSIIPLVSIDILAKETVPALLNLNTWLVFYRSLNHTKRREEMQLVLLCLFLLVMTGMLTASLVFGAQLVLFSGLAILFLSLGTVLDCKSEGQSETVSLNANWSEFEGWIHVARLAPYRNFIVGMAMYTSLIGVAGISFLFIPRLDVKNKVSIFDMKSTSTLTGFSENIGLGEVTSIKNDDRVALRVDIEGEMSLPATPYWRMLALDEYNAGSFSLSASLRENLKLGISSPFHAVRYWPNRRFSESPSALSRDRWTFYVEPGVSKFLPTLGNFKQFTHSNLDELRVGPQMHVFALEETPGRMISYQLEDVTFSDEVPDVSDRFAYDFKEGNRRDRVRTGGVGYPNTLLELPEEPAARAYLELLAEKISDGESLTPLEFAARTTEYLSETHEYSMQINLPNNDEIKDPVVRWIDSGLAGHCEFFASSLTLIARAAGYKARVVIGFKGGAWNAFEKYYMVKNSDAHAWCEVYDEKGSWFRVDPTPGSGLPTNASPIIALSEQNGETDTVAYIDSLRMLWYRRIVNFDEQAQKEAATQLKDFFLAYVQVAEEWALRALKEIYGWIVAPWSMKKFFYTSLSLVVAVGVLLYQRNLALNYRELILIPFRRGDPIRRKATKLLRKAELRKRTKRVDSQRREQVIDELKRLRFGHRDSWTNPRIVFKEARRYL